MKIYTLTYNDINTQDLSIFVDIIYDNFIELSEYPLLLHNKNEIEKNIKSKNSVIIVIMNDSNKMIGFLTSNIIKYF
jgi:hypothetical protein